MSLAADIAEALTDGFDAARQELYGVDSKLVLLKENGGTSAFVVKANLAGGWLPEFSEFFGTTTFQVADVSDVFGAKVRDSSHLMVVNSDNAGLNNVLFEIVDGTQPPLGTDAFWKIRARSLSRRISLPA